MYQWGVFSLRWCFLAIGSKLRFLVLFGGEKLTSFLGGCFQIKKLKEQLGERQKNGRLDPLRPEDGVLENGTDVHVMDLQSKCPAVCWRKRFDTCGFSVLVWEGKGPTPQKSLITKARRHFPLYKTEQDGQVGEARVFLCDLRNRTGAPKRARAEMPP